MISYFKHTDGEAFTLNGENYSGFFHINNNNAYTDKLSSVDSQQLEPKSNFITELYLNSKEFDTTYNNIPTLTQYFSNTFDLLDANGMSEYLKSINNNNLTCYKSVLLANPTVYKYEETNGRYYGIISDDEESQFSVPVKHDYRGNIEPFSISQYWKFLDDIVTGELIVNSSEDFKYICSDGINDYILSGSFSQDIPLTLSYIKKNVEFDITLPAHNTPNLTYSIYHDLENNKLLIVKLDSIEIYDTKNLDECNELILVDIISSINYNPPIFKYNLWNTFDEYPNLTQSKWDSKYRIYGDISTNNIQFGQNMRTSLYNNVLMLYNKYSNDVYQQIILSNYGISNVLSLDIRSVDDYIGIIHKTIDDKLKISFFDPLSIDSSIITYNILSVTSSNGLKLSFSSIDSNVFYINTPTEYQSRYISAPEYPSGRLELCDLLYPTDLIWNTAQELYNYLVVKWDNANNKSNNFNNLVVSQTFANNKMYMLLHNVGRLYALQQPVNGRFLNAIPLDLTKSFTSMTCNQSSIGLYINSELSKLIYDLVNMVNSSSSSFIMSELGPILSELQVLDYNYNNLYYNGNETLNVIVLQRISTILTSLQYKLLPK
jgi:hypothetical protein